MAVTDTRLDLLDSPTEWLSFSRQTQPPSSHPDVWESSIVLSGMHCAACAVTIEDALRMTPGVLSADISSANYRGRVVWDERRTRPSYWMKSIVASGYGVAPAQDALRFEQRRNETRLALWRWLVAGLCMMQVMMYAMPEYVALPGEMTAEAKNLMRWASWVLTLPVLLFSCKPFFVSAWLDISHRRVSMDLPVALGIVITFLVSTLGTFNLGSIWVNEVYFDSLTMFVFILLTGRWLELRMRDQTAGALEALMNRVPDSALRQTRSGEFERVLLRQLTAGDTVRVSVGEAFPTDGCIIEGTTHADEALLTGEAKPITKSRGDKVIAGSYNLDSSVLVFVEKVGEETRFAQMVRLMEQASLDKPHLAQLADRLAKPFLIGVLLIAGAVAVLGWSDNPAQALMRAVAVLIVTCPCALSIATPAAMLASAGALAKKGILVRRLQALEALSKVTIFIFDKTGTLTEDGLTLSQVTVREGMSESTACQLAALLAQDSLHPISKAIVAKSQPTLCDGADNTIISKVENAGQGISAQLKLHQHTETYCWGSAQFCGVPPLQTTSAQAHLSDSHGWLASFEFQERIRSDAAQTLTDLKNSQIAVELLSGDSELATQHLAHQLHINRYQGLCTPDMKLVRLKVLQQKGDLVAMVGDGLNDGPALAGADVSFAFGRAVPLTQSKSDFLVLGRQLSHVALVTKQASTTMRIVKQNLVWALLYNVAAVPLAVTGYLPAWLASLGMASSSLVVIGNAMRLRRIE